MEWKYDNFIENINIMIYYMTWLWGGRGCQPSSIPKLFELFREKEELEDVDGLQLMYLVVRGLSKWDLYLVVVHCL